MGKKDEFTAAVLAVASSFINSKHAYFKGKIGNLLTCSVQLLDLKDPLCFSSFQGGLNLSSVIVSCIEKQLRTL